jgi:hypothetical protein
MLTLNFMTTTHDFGLNNGRDEPSARSVSEPPARWRGPLLRVHHTLGHTFRLADAAARSIDQAESLILSGGRPNQVRDCLMRAWDQLSGAMHRANTSGRYLSEALALAPASLNEDASMQQLFTEAFQKSADAVTLIAELLAYIQAVSEHLSSVTVDVKRCGQLLARLLEYLPEPAEPADPRFHHERPKSPPSSAYAEGFRRVTRGRSPPRQRTACLHAVSAAAERPVRLRSLS